MRDTCDAIVIGSGFGGAVAACRLAQAGLRVTILERGRRYPRGSFPRNFRDPDDGWFWARGQGLFDVKPVQEMQVVQAAGFGGGSLVYANVHLRPPPDVFRRGWPVGYTRDALDPYYDLVGTMLDVKPITASGVLPPKALAMKRAAQSLGREAQFCFPNLAVELDHPGEVRPNAFGVPQGGCTGCGECDIGCNEQAKNTLDLNYLALAERFGAEAFTRCEVWKIDRDDDGSYVVHYRDHAAASAERAIRARKVFVCAGAVNTTELLLRCRDEHGTLPDIGGTLGHGYSGNGDFLAAAYGVQPPFEPSRGPVITTALVYQYGSGDDALWFTLQDGGFPKAIAPFTKLLAPGGDWLEGGAALLRPDLERAFGAAARRIFGDAPPDDAGDVALFLAMGRDRADGRLTLTPITGTLNIDWDVPKNRPLYEHETRLVDDVAEAMGGKAVLNPFWKRLHLPVSVHNLGGCPMSDDPATGVTSDIGEVYNYPGLFVLDGAVLPSATGVNPASTIAAVAERNIERILRAHLGNPTWQAPERKITRAVPDPLAALRIPPSGVAAAKTPSVGIAFTETMKGFVLAGDDPPTGSAAYDSAERRAQRLGSTASFTLTITIPELDRFLVEKAHAGIARGVVHVTGITPPEGAPVTAGVFNLFTDGAHFYERRMLYLLPFVGADGQPYVLDGFKEVKDHGHFDVWGATSTLYTVVRRGHAKDGPVVATGILRILMTDFLRQITTFEVPGARSDVDRAAALARFGASFLGNLWDCFVRPKLG